MRIVTLITGGLSTAAALLLIHPPAALAQADSACEQREQSSSIYVTNQATIRLPPDRATLFLIVDVPAATPAQATRLVDYGAAPTTSAGGAPAVPGAPFTARSVIRVELQNLDLLSKVATTSFATGATLMGPIQFGAADVDAARRSALARALAQARQDADAMARAAGGHLGRLLDLNMNPMYSPELNPQQLPMGGPQYQYDAAAAWRTPPEVVRAWTVAGRWEVRQR